MGPFGLEVTIATKRKDTRDLAKQAVARILGPLVDFLVGAGLSTRDVHSMLREAAVSTVANRQLEALRRVNISGIAATTGIPRAEIARILKPGRQTSEPRAGLGHRREKSTASVLAAWYSEPRFTDSSGQPADLSLYGRGATFDSLVKTYCRGIPTRAVLEELVRARAVQVLDSQRVRAKSSLLVDRGISPHAIKAFGDRASELIATMLQNMRKPNAPQFVASVFEPSVADDALPLFRREILAKGTEFLTEVHESLAQGSQKKRIGKSSTSISVTVFCHESRDRKPRVYRVPKKRKNFRRDLS